LNADFAKSREAAVNLFNLTNGKIKPTVCESGYFLCLDISGCKDLIPEKYFKVNENYETDADTKVLSMKFPAEMKQVPLDFACCRWLACEKGLSCQPLSNFYCVESPYTMYNYMRVSICKPSSTFTDPKIIEVMKNI